MATHTLKKILDKEKELQKRIEDVQRESEKITERAKIEASERRNEIINNAKNEAQKNLHSAKNTALKIRTTAIKKADFLREKENKKLYEKEGEVIKMIKSIIGDSEERWQS